MTLAISRPQIPSIFSMSSLLNGAGFRLSPDVQIIVDSSVKNESPTTLDFARTFRGDLLSVASLPYLPEVSQNIDSPRGTEPRPIISLSIDTSLKYTYFNGKPSDEGYELVISENEISLTSSAPIGLWWGTRTILQQVALSASNGSVHFLPLASISDSPGWEIRGFMLDAGRHWFDTKFLADLCTYASFFKLNEFHIHASDNLWNPSFLYGEGNEGWKNLYAAFRFQPPLGSPLEGLVPPIRKNESWTKEEFLNMQESCAHHGVIVVPEIDTPGHSLVINQWKPELMEMGQPDHLNLSYPDTIPTIKSIWDEFLPWFSSTDEVSIGADEYDSSLANDYISFVNEMSDYISFKSGKSIRVWGTYEPSETLSISKNVTIQHWDFPGDTIPIQLLQSGYDIINSEQYFLYLDEKTSEDGQFPQELNEDLIWSGAPAGKGWAPNIFSPTDPTNNTNYDDLHLRGSVMALWCDWGNNATTQLEIYYQLEKSLALFSEKVWSGSGVRENELTKEEFDAVYPILNAAAPGQNLNRVPVPPIRGNVVFEYAKEVRTPFETSFDSIGAPYILTFSVKPSTKYPYTGTLFSGTDSKLHVSNLTFEATGQLYSIGINLPIGELTTVTIRATKEYTYAVINGVEENRYFWTTTMNIWGDYMAVGNMSFAAPSKEIGTDGFEGSIHNISLVIGSE
ncbi:glycoside hydrolase [Abortiporus biennis]|nr:glycoside hydrolase [Abortiporus biennis]